MLCQLLRCQQNLKWRLMPNKMAGKCLTSNIASVQNQWILKRFRLLIGQNDVVSYGKTYISTFFSGSRRHFNRSVDTLLIKVLPASESQCQEVLGPLQFEPECEVQGDCRDCWFTFRTNIEYVTWYCPEFI